jgi:beta-lactamase class A
VSATVSRRRVKRRRLIAAVVAIDLIGIGALAFALTRSSHHHSAAAADAAAASAPVAHPQAPQTLIGDPTTSTTTTTNPVAHHRRHPKPRAASPASAPSTTDVGASFDRLTASLPGTAGVAVGSLGGGPVATYGSLQIGHAWSTMKVPVLTTLLAQLEHSGGTLSPSQRADATAALEASDNAAAEALFSALESSDGGLIGASSAVQATLRRAGDEQTVINTAPNSSGFTTWGQSEWSTAGEVAFYRSLANGCLLSASNTSYVLSLMGQVESDQRWGAGSAGFPSGVSVAFKGGWGPENGYLVRQTAIVGAGSGGYVISMIAKPSDGSFATGTQILTQIGAWAARALPPASSGGGSGGCP